MSVEFKIENLDVLAEALQRLGCTVLSQNAGSLQFRDEMNRAGIWANGKLTVPEGFDIDAVKREYSRVAIERVAKTRNWTMKKVGVKAGKLTRRY